jgi:hypothetical protein
VTALTLRRKPARGSTCIRVSAGAPLLSCRCFSSRVKIKWVRRWLSVWRRQPADINTG